MFNGIYKDKTVLITGNTGFKGAWLSAWLLKCGAKVVGYSIDIPTKPSIFEVLKLEEKVKHYYGDVANYETLKKVIDSELPDFVFHLAAQPIVYQSYNNPLLTYQTNVIGTATVLEVLRNYSKDCVAIIITSDKCYDNVEWTWGYREIDRLGGKDPYSASKAAAEIIFNSYFHSFFSGNEKVKIASARAGNVIGGGDWAANRIVPDVYRAWQKNETVVIRSPNATRPWQHVLEPLSGYLSLAQQLFEGNVKSGESFNFGPPANQNHKVISLIDELGDLSDIEEDKRYKIEENKSLHEAGLLKLNCDKALHFLNWEANLNFKQTANYTASWYLNYYNNKMDMFDFTNNQIAEYINCAHSKKMQWTL